MNAERKGSLSVFLWGDELLAAGAFFGVWCLVLFWGLVPGTFLGFGSKFSC